ncbi:AsmA family protein [Sphingomonas sp. ID0503]|uniref:AsmA family protein n=1 Tax=Sphingomonas sp. ID0503 TaxID=3399691 RepID=UPI003AFA7F9E
MGVIAGMDRRWALAAGITAAVAVLLLIGVAAFPWSVLRSVIESRLAERFGRPVSIAAVERVDFFGLSPRVRISGVRVAQADWAGRGDFARIERAEATLPLRTLLSGGLKPRDIVVEGLTLALARDKQGRTNWDRPGEREPGARSTDLGNLIIRRARISYDDARQNRRLVANVAADARGVRARGTGTVRGAPVRLSVDGPAILSGERQPWPFHALIDGPALRMEARGTMDRPLDTDRMTLDVTARAHDLKLIDAVIEAGLFRTRPVTLKAHIRHDFHRWVVTGMTGTVGHSKFAANLTVTKTGGRGVERRTKLDGDLRMAQLDPDDLSSAQARAAAAALERRIGPRMVPNTRIDIGKIDRTDGTIRFAIGPIVSARGPSPIVAAKGRLTLDHRLLTIEPVAVRLSSGVVTGRAVIDQRGGPPEPRLTLDLKLSDGTYLSFESDIGAVTGKVSARARLSGVGETIREAVGRSNGTLGLFVRDGALPLRYAAALGFDIGKAIRAETGDQARLRCLGARLVLKNGRGTVDPFVVDTSESQLHGTGDAAFPGETIALNLTGAPKGRSLLRIPGNARLIGTMRQPDLDIPPEVKSVGNILKAIGRKISGHEGPLATDADCQALGRRVLAGG